MAMDAYGRDPLKVLVVHSELPHPDRDACSLRLYRILKMLVEDGHEVTFLGRGGLRQDRYLAKLLAIGVHEVHPVDPERFGDVKGWPVSQWQIPLLDVPALLAGGNFDVAWLSLYDVAEQYLPLIRAHAPSTRVIVDSSDIQWVRELRGAELAGDQAAIAAAHRTRERERAVYGAADLCVSISELDAQLTRELAPEVPSAIVSMAQPFDPPPIATDGREGLVFVGNFYHAPNVDAILAFHATVWPRVRRQNPELTLTIVGTAPPESVKALAGDGVTVTGWVPEVDPYLRRARVAIAPLRYGAGIKGKIAEAIAAGLPVVTTAIGAEGMSLEDGRHALIADAPAAMAEAIDRLCSDDALWHRIATGAPAHLDAVMGAGVARAGIRTALATVAGPRWEVSADSIWLEQTLVGFAALSADTRPSLVVTVSPDTPNGPPAVQARLLDTVQRLGLQLDALGDIEISWEGTPQPTRTRRVEHAQATPVAERAITERAVRRLGSTPTAAQVAVVVQTAIDIPTVSRQLEAVARALAEDDVDLVIVARRVSEDVERAMVGIRAGRVLRWTEPPGRAEFQRLALEATTAPIVIMLGPLALPQAGFVGPLAEAIRNGASMAGPVIDGAHGLTVGEDGSLWPRAKGAATPVRALALDCLAAARDTWEDAPTELTAREGHAESQLAEWARARGPLAAPAAAVVDRHDAGPTSTIICTRNRAEELPDAVALLVAYGATRGSSEVIIVDNASTDHTADVAARLAAAHPGVRVVHEPQPGLSHARNTGARVAANEELCYLDDDARPAPGWRESLAWALRVPEVAAAGGPVCGLWPELREPDWPPPGLEGSLSILEAGDLVRVLMPPEIVFGANWAIRRSALLAADGFDGHLGYGPDVKIGSEEVAVAWRLALRRIGVTLFVPGAAVGHRIDPARVCDSFVVERFFKVGIEHAHLRAEREGTREERLVGEASQAATDLMSEIRLTGELSLEEALARIQGSALELRRRVRAAEALGLLSATALLLGEQEVDVDELKLTLRPENLRGVLSPVPALA